MSDGPVMRASISDHARLLPPKRPPGVGPGRKRRGWTSRSVATSMVVSACWHLLVLGVLGLAVHPFTLPSEPAPVDVELIPPFPEDRPKPVPLTEPQPVTPAPRVRAEPAPPPTPAVPAPAQPTPPVQQTQPTPAPAAPAETEPQAPVQLHPPQAPQQKAIDLRQAPGRAAANLSRQAPKLDIPAPPAAEAPPRPATPVPAKPAVAQPAPAAQPSLAPPAPITLQPPVQALTNDRTAHLPVLITPPQRRPTSSLKSDTLSAPNLAPAGGGGEPAGGGADGGGVLKPYGPITGDFVPDADSGMRLRLGCATPDTYHMSAADRAACLNRLGQQAKTAPELGINIPANKQAQWDHQTACRAAVRGGGVPTSTSTSAGTSVTGLGDNPTLRQCAPSDR